AVLLDDRFGPVGLDDRVVNCPIAFRQRGTQLVHSLAFGRIAAAYQPWPGARFHTSERVPRYSSSSFLKISSSSMMFGIYGRPATPEPARVITATGYSAMNVRDLA
ncbi:MAG: hypothetical protein M3R21_04405, partial [Candidatus Dormibacteraeota bacterium]|nr:hypothetical protein [Candidatus Dormibacteraeota bacterium]